ncbi:DsbA family protein [Pseudonocardia sp. HH130630-07]|uniref:DsbA family protein n=1 Tax=Pseudonocardia sp. HH130630-07 TaxID=1690815 RepID=UPI0008153BF9|nr:thioredoxin domain-containing protein [Pseudonocardia sp. HH130630-07]ANY05856.1 protein-disulfide isomerase [Pseudonocardia sp. HH130630-07]
MGRSERERHGAAQARLQAAGITPPKKSRGRQGLLIAGGVLIAVLLGGGYTVWQNHVSQPAGPPEPAYAVARAGVVVTAGEPAAPVTVDVYEDYLCPFCKQAETQYGDRITAALNSGRAKVNYHHIAILDDRTTPPGYSTRAGNAALCAVDAGIFPAYHARLYAEQPAEGSTGRTVEELTAIGTELGATGDFGGCVARQGDSRAIADATTAAVDDPVVAPGGRLELPTIVLNGRKVDLANTGWLDELAG